MWNKSKNEDFIKTWKYEKYYHNAKMLTESKTCWNIKKQEKTLKNTKNIKHKQKHPKREKNINENITTTQKYEKYYHNAKIWKMSKTQKILKI